MPIHTATGEGMSVLVGTVDRDGVPACCRGIAISSGDDLKNVTVYVPLATSRDVVANAAATRRIAVGTSMPVEHIGYQMKGIVKELRLARDAEAAFIEQRLARFADVLAKIGMPRHITMSMTHWPAFAIEFTVESVFDQTPGPKAGNEVR